MTKEVSFQRTATSKPITLTRATFVCEAKVQADDECRVVKITFKPEGRRHNQELWFTFTGDAPLRPLNGSRVSTKLDLCFKPQGKRPPLFLCVAIGDKLTPLYTTRDEALSNR